jgi:hypothetical protein
LAFQMRAAAKLLCRCYAESETDRIGTVPPMM